MKGLYSKWWFYVSTGIALLVFFLFVFRFIEGFTFTRDGVVDFQMDSNRVLKIGDGEFDMEVVSSETLVMRDASWERVLIAVEQPKPIGWVSSKYFRLEHSGDLKGQWYIEEGQDVRGRITSLSGDTVTINIARRTLLSDIFWLGIVMLGLWVVVLYLIATITGEDHKVASSE